MQQHRDGATLKALGEDLPSYQLWDAASQRSWQRLGGGSSESWLAHSCHLLPANSSSAVLSPQKISRGLQRCENAGILLMQAADNLSCFTVHTQSSSWSGNKSLQHKGGYELAGHQLCQGNSARSCLVAPCKKWEAACRPREWSAFLSLCVMMWGLESCLEADLAMIAV